MPFVDIVCYNLNKSLTYTLRLLNPPPTYTNQSTGIPYPDRFYPLNIPIFVVMCANYDPTGKSLL